MIEAGKLRDRVRIEVSTTTPDPTYGGPVSTWTTLVASVACEIQDELPSKSERVTTGLSVAMGRSRIRMRYRTDVRSDMRLVRLTGLVGKIYQIVSGPAVLGAREGLEMMVEEYSTQGG